MRRFGTPAMPTGCASLPPSLAVRSAMNRTAILFAFASAALFGLSAPAAKALLASVSPALLAGLFYCGAGIGVAVLRRLSWMFGSQGHAAEASLTGRDLPWNSGRRDLRRC